MGNSVYNAARFGQKTSNEAAMNKRTLLASAARWRPATLLQPRARSPRGWWLAACLLMLGTGQGLAQTQTPTTISPVSITRAAPTYTQNFDTLATSGTSSLLPQGFAFVETDTNSNTTYTAGAGGFNNGDTYSFGAAGSTERAFGTLRDSGRFSSTIGAVFTNNTGAAVSQITITYTGEQWRLGATGRPDYLNFQYRPEATALNLNATYTSYAPLDFTAPITSGSIGAMNGNDPANRQTITATISGLSLDDGHSIAFRWVDFDATGLDDGLAIDDLTVSFGAPVPEPATWLAGGLVVAAGAAKWVARRRRLCP